MKYLLIGNPNVGKSSLFNRLTRTFAQVGNLGGVTVESKIGSFNHGDIIDLPGTYSVAPSSEDEGVVTRTLVSGDYDRLINIVDATHLKRNLHLTFELLELGQPMNLVINMTDELEASGFCIEEELLQEYLGVSIHFVSAKKGSGIHELELALKDNPLRKSFKVSYDPIVEDGITRIEELLRDVPSHLSSRWLSIQLLWEFRNRDNHPR